MVPSSVMNLIVDNGPRLAVLAGTLYFYWNYPWLILLVWAGVFGLFYYEKSLRDASSRTFRSNRPFHHYGLFGAQQQLLFAKASEFDEEVLDSVRHTAWKYPGSACSNVDIKDEQAPGKPYNKTFLKVEYVTRYNTKITTLFQANVVSTNLCLQWWILACGEVTPLKLGRFILTAPLTFPYWIVGWFMRNYSIHTAIAANIDSSYDVFDISVWVEAFVEDLYHDLITTLKELGVDVSAFEKTPPALQLFNFGNVSGMAIAIGSNNQVAVQTSTTVRTTTTPTDDTSTAAASGSPTQAPALSPASDNTSAPSPAAELLPTAAMSPTPVIATSNGAETQVISGE